MRRCKGVHPSAGQGQPKDNYWWRLTLRAGWTVYWQDGSFHYDASHNISKIHNYFCQL
jgi:hypothetical protein